MSWALARPEITGLATPGDVRLLRHVIAAEQDRMAWWTPRRCSPTDPAYSSPFVSMPD